MTQPNDPGDGRTVIASEAVEPTSPPRTPRRASETLVPGDLLNGIYRVERFIARGGMGDVYEGVNVETDERVAIKAMRAHLADDDKVLALFRKEARVLTRLAHPAIVQYRVLAREPTLELYYIVMDFIDGEPLSSMLDGRRPGASKVVELARRLAAGLAVAHEHGAVHRDMSPDNVLLPEGLVERAKIIDFGIAKSLDVAAETVVGNGFAGKIGYVAPEQFGDFDRQVGPWTDVYSTALVLLAFARGRSSDMGSTLAEAVERRRAGPDLDGLPPVLEPLFRAMLVPDPRNRIRSMQAVIAELDRLVVTEADEDAAIEATPPLVLREEREPRNATSAPPAPLTTFVPIATTPPKLEPPASDEPEPLEQAGVCLSETVLKPVKRWRAPVVLGVGAVACGGLALLLRPGSAPEPVQPPLQQAAARPAPVKPALAVAARVVVAAPSPPPVAGSPFAQVSCAWLSEKGAPGDPARLVSGAAGDRGALQAAVAAATATPGVNGVKIDTSGVLHLARAQCAAVDAMRAFDDSRGVADDRLMVSAPRIEMAASLPGCRAAPSAWAELSFVAPAAGKPFTLVELTSTGTLRSLVSGREAFDRLARANPTLFTDLGGGRLRVRACQQSPGMKGFVLVEGAGASDLGLASGAEVRASADFADRFRRLAAAQGGTTRAVWLQVVASPSIASPALDPKLSATPIPGAVAAAQAPGGRPAVEACRRYTGNGWQEMGYTTRTSCVELAFRARCEIVNAQFGSTALRRYQGFIQAQADGFRWITIARSSCLSYGPPQPSPKPPADRGGNGGGVLRRLWPWSGKDQANIVGPASRADGA